MEKKLKSVRNNLLFATLLIILVNFSALKSAFQSGQILSRVSAICVIFIIVLFISSYIYYKKNILLASKLEIISIILYLIIITINNIITLILPAVVISKAFDINTIVSTFSLLSLLSYVIPLVLLADVISLIKLCKNVNVTENNVQYNVPYNTKRSFSLGTVIFRFILFVGILMIWNLSTIDKTIKNDTNTTNNSTVSSTADENVTEIKIEIPSSSTLSENNTSSKNEDIESNTLLKIQFKDTTFYNAIKSQINSIKYYNDKALTMSLYTQDIAQVKSLVFTEFTGASIKDISGIKYFTSLTELTLQDSNYLTDISELAYLTNLEYLYLDNNKMISDLSPLSELKKLKKLKKLDLDYNNSMENIKNINAIANLTNLESLDTSIYNMEYDLKLLQNTNATFTLPDIFAVAKLNGANIMVNSNDNINITSFDNNIITASASSNGKITISISGGVYDKINFNLNLIFTD